MVGSIACSAIEDQRVYALQMDVHLKMKRQ